MIEIPIWELWMYRFNSILLIVYVFTEWFGLH